MASEDDPWIIPTPDTEMSDMQFVGEIFRAKKLEDVLRWFTDRCNCSCLLLTTNGVVWNCFCNNKHYFMLSIAMQGKNYATSGNFCATPSL